MIVLTVSSFNSLFVFIFLLFHTCLIFTNSQELRLCVRTVKEADKCEWLKAEVAARNYPTTETGRNINSVVCVTAQDSYDCLVKIEDGQADVVNLDAGTAYYASINFVSTLLNAERYDDDEETYHAVAVISSSSEIRSPLQLRGKRLCSSGVGEAAGWTLPLSLMAEQGIMPVTTCNVDVKTAAGFFGSMCAPGSLNSYNNPFGDNPVSTCQQCGSTGADWCTYKDKYAGGEGPLLCLQDNKADVAFMRSIDVDYLTKPHHGEPAAYNPDEYMLLCPAGGTKEIGSYEACSWGLAPSNVMVTSAARYAQDQEMYRQFFERLSMDFPPLSDSGGPNSGSAGNATTAAPLPGNTDRFTLFNTNYTYGLNSIVSSAANNLKKEYRDGYSYINGRIFQQKIDSLQTCSLASVRFCVVSEYEMRKCENMLLALKSKNLRPEMDCILDNSTQNCMRKIQEGDADIIALDAGDVYEAGKYYGLVPIANENYGDTGSFYYAVAVSRKTESKLTLFNLIARDSCHGSIRSASGWIYPVLSLMETGQITPGKCEAVKKVGELFRRSCVPGILDSHYNKAGTNPVNLCENCGAGGMDRCQRNTRELYYGDSGAFRCLVENAGDVAYVRHMTPRDNTDGRNADFWARNRRSDDYELLCKNGKRAALGSWSNCYLAKIPARAVVAAGYRSAEERKIFWNLLNYAQQFYSSDSDPYFTMFDSGVDQDDLLFSDSTVKLVEVAPELQTYESYLGESFLKAVNTLDQFDCTSNGHIKISLTLSLLLISVLYCLIF
ncbi:transferrin 2-like [Watersipora subatra]|uniref:transferrin 2-like n=1 Tax=Watersipora subatra TaxID=2589382 RepID=UPI00355BBB88